MAQITYLCSEEVTFGRLQFQSVLLKMFQEGPQSFEVLLLGIREYYHIIQVYQGIGQVDTTALHQGEVDGRIAPPSNISCKC